MGLARLAFLDIEIAYAKFLHEQAVKEIDAYVADMVLRKPNIMGRVR